MSYLRVYELYNKHLLLASDSLVFLFLKLSFY